MKTSQAEIEEILELVNESEKLNKEDKYPEAFKKYDKALRKMEILYQTERLANILLWVEVIYLAFLVFLAYFTWEWTHIRIWLGLRNELAVQTAWCGALGGVTIAIFGIYEHMRKRDFDVSYKLWYICKPIIGGIFGWIAYLIYFAGIVSVQGYGKDGTNLDIKTPEVIYLISFLAGFSERFFLRLIDKLMSVLTSYENKPENGASKKGP